MNNYICLTSSKLSRYKQYMYVDCKNYIADLKDSENKKVKRAYEHWQAELKRMDERNQWMKQFLNSLENI